MRPGAVVPDLPMRGLLPVCFRQGNADVDRPGLFARGAGAGLRLYRAQTEIREVILTGGDPLSWPTRRWRKSAPASRRSRHVRLLAHPHPRAGGTPSRITSGLVEAFAGRADGSVVTHFNHARGDHRRRRAGLPHLAAGRLVLLNHERSLERRHTTRSRCWRSCAASLCTASASKPITSTTATSRAAWHIGHHHCRGPALAGALRQRLSGICNPVYVLDLPDGGGKVPDRAVLCRGVGRGSCRYAAGWGGEGVCEVVCE